MASASSVVSGLHTVATTATAAVGAYDGARAAATSTVGSAALTVASQGVDRIVDALPSKRKEQLGSVAAAGAACPVHKLIKPTVSTEKSRPDRKRSAPPVSQSREGRCGSGQ